MDMATLMLAAAVVAQGFIRPKRAGLWPAIGPRWRERGAIAVVQTVHAKARDVIEPLQKQGIDVLGCAPKEFADYVRSETAKWTRVVAAAGMKQ